MAKRKIQRVCDEVTCERCGIEYSTTFGHDCVPERRDAIVDGLYIAAKLVLAIHNNPKRQAPQWRVKLDPASVVQIESAVHAYEIEYPKRLNK